MLGVWLESARVCAATAESVCLCGKSDLLRALLTAHVLGVAERFRGLLYLASAWIRSVRQSVSCFLRDHFPRGCLDYKLTCLPKQQIVETLEKVVEQVCVTGQEVFVIFGGL